MKIKRMNRIFPIILILILIFILCYFKLDDIGMKSNKTLIEESREVIEINKEKDVEKAIKTEQQDKKDQYNSSIDDLKKQYKNTNIKVKLNIDYLGISVIVTQASDNNYYLNHDAYNNSSDFGNPYLDYRTGSNLDKERQINIYSHNSSNQSYTKHLPFSKLKLLLDNDSFDKVKEIYLYTEEKLIKYELYAVKVITTDNEHMVLDSSSNDMWQKHLDSLLKNTKYCKGKCHLSSNDKLLLLQTCNYNPSNSYILVIARKIN